MNWESKIFMKVYFLILFGFIGLFLVSCCDSDMGESTQYFVPITKTYLEFSDGLIIDEIASDSCTFSVQSLTAISHDSFLFSPRISRPTPILENFIGFHLLFYGYETPDLSKIEDHEVIWNNININDHDFINQSPYKMNFILEYIKDPDDQINTRYLNSQNGNFVGGFGPPYSTDEGGMKLTNVQFSDTDYHPACDEDKFDAIRFQAELSGELYNIDYTDTISVIGSFDLLILTTIN